MEALSSVESELIVKSKLTEAIASCFVLPLSPSEAAIEKLVRELNSSGIHLIYRSPEEQTNDRVQDLVSMMEDIRASFHEYSEEEIRKLSFADRSKYYHNQRMAMMGINPEVKKFLDMTWTDIAAVLENQQPAKKDSPNERILKLALSKLDF